MISRATGITETRRLCRKLRRRKFVDVFRFRSQTTNRISSTEPECARKTKNLRPTVNRQPGDRGIYCRAESTCSFQMGEIPDYSNNLEQTQKVQEECQNISLLFFVTVSIFNCQTSGFHQSNSASCRDNAGWTWPHRGRDKPRKSAQNMVSSIFDGSCHTEP